MSSGSMSLGSAAFKSRQGRSFKSCRAAFNLARDLLLLLLLQLLRLLQLLLLPQPLHEAKQRLLLPQLHPHLFPQQSLHILMKLLYLKQILLGLEHLLLQTK